MRTILTTVAVCIPFFSQAAPGDSTNCVPPSGLVSLWPAESNAADIIDSNTGVLLNGATFAPGKLGTAFSLHDGAHVRIADKDNLHLTNALTLTAWVYPSSLGSDFHIIAKWDVVFEEQNQKSYETWLSQGKFIFTVAATGDDLTGPSMNVLSTNTVPPNQWTYVAATYDGSTMKVYVNGQLDNQAAFPYGIFPGTNDLAIGAIVGGVPAGQYLYSFDGLIDEPTIYNRALSAAEIQSIYLCQSSPPTISLGLYPGLTINASPGQTVAIQYVTNLASPNWATITNLPVTQSNQLWIDTEVNVTSAGHPQRFYRAMLVP